ncbi:MAG TPA: polyphosphate:AMP phosphotransferase, partial [Planctomycetota bacterium]|nr:polyphosphate:AMP phosphotransferase [Planctomycetota bacterium]
GGVDGAGKGETVNVLNEWMDPRHIQTNAPGEPSDEERERPPMWRFWRLLPPKGKIGIFFGAWHTAPIVRRVYGETTEAELEKSVHEIVRFERMLCDEGAIVLKFWFHLSKRRQKKRLRALEKDPRTRWRVTDTDWKHFALYDRFREVSERTLRMTSTAEAPWHIVEGSDARYRSMFVGKTILGAIRRRLDAIAAAAAAPKVEPAAPPAEPRLDNRHILSALDLTGKIAKEDYEDQLEKLQGRLNLLSRKKRFKRRSIIAVFEGFDAAGKGGAIRRVTQALDARQYRIIPIAAPNEEERAQPYMWRFWRHIPRLGRVTIFDRSWYGRVLVERVEGFCKPADWMRAYGEINDFEDQLASYGIILFKFWLTLSKEEQLRRFKEREETRFKRFKITEEDWRNREKWELYESAVCDMIEKTSGGRAPWTLVPAEDKYFARIQVLTTLCEGIEAAL